MNIFKYLIGLGFAALLAAPFASAQQSTFSQLNLRGTHNGWSTTAMSLSADHQWSVTVTFGANADERFKFDVRGEWSQNYGDNNGDGLADRNGNDIFIGAGAGDYLITFDDASLRYTVERIGFQANQPPIANAGADISVVLGEAAQFDASGSTDVDGTIVSYQWSNGASGVSPSVTYSLTGVFPVTLMVTDNEGASDMDEVIVTVSEPRTQIFSQLWFRGTANAWATTPFTAMGNNVWQIDVDFGAASNERFKFDVFGDWSQNYGDRNGDNIADLAGSDIAITEGEGSYRISFNDETFAYTVVKLGATNRAPVADAGEDIAVTEGDMVQFDASGSFDPDGTIVSYAWSNGMTGEMPSRVFNTPGSFAITLTVTDNEGATSTDTVELTVSDSNPQMQKNLQQLYLRGTHNTWAPLAMTLVADFQWRAEVQFGAASDERFKFDVFGDWSENYGDNQPDGIVDRSGADIAITEGEGRYRISFNDSNYSYTVVRLGALNEAPVANAGEDQLVDLGSTVVLDASASFDPDGDIVSYQWSNGDSGTTSSQVFSQEGEFDITLTVTDNNGAIDSDAVRIVVTDLSQVPAECFSNVNFLGDLDQDGLPDCAELPSVGYRNEQYYLLGARSGRPDLFVEIDWMDTADEGVIPQREAMEKVKQAFTDQGIAIHFDTGALYHESAGLSPKDFDLGGGNSVPFAQTITLGNSSGEDVAGLRTLKTQHMSAIRQSGPWYYMVFGSSQNYNGTAGSSGIAEINGQHSIVSLGKWGLSRSGGAGTNRLLNYQAGTIMHEFGHVLGLRHGGFENKNRKPNYLSVMSYDYQLNGLPTIGDNEADRILRRVHGYACVNSLSNDPSSSYLNFVIDYSHGLSIPLNENGPLNEQVGFGHPGSTAVDWNCDGDTTDEVFSLELNSDSALNLQEDHDDWGNINYYYFENPVNNATIATPTVPTPLEDVEISEEEQPSPEFFEYLRNAD